MPPNQLYRPFALACLTLLLSQLPMTAQKISPLGSNPHWEELDPYQNVVTKAAFMRGLEEVYTGRFGYKSMIKIGDDYAEIRKQGEGTEVYRLQFRAEGAEQTTPQRYWRRAGDLTPPTDAAPLEGVKIALDPGHLGGEWAEMEERYFKVGNDDAIREGDLTLWTAKLLKPRLEELGATVEMVRDSSEPRTAKRPADLKTDATLFLTQRGVAHPTGKYNGASDKERFFSTRWQSEKLFYRTSEIIARALRINEVLRPDLVLCLHFNAEEWGDATDPQYVDSNHLHVLVNGAYSAGELVYDDIRFEMMRRLLQGIHREELALAEHIGPSMAAATGLKPYIYPGENARRVTSSEHIWARNLLANRIFSCPVLYFEPFVMNNETVAKRLTAGNYEGRTRIGDEMRESIFKEYVDGIVNGLVAYYKSARGSGPEAEIQALAPSTEDSDLTEADKETSTTAPASEAAPAAEAPPQATPENTAQPTEDSSGATILTPPSEASTESP